MSKKTKKPRSKTRMIPPSHRSLLEAILKVETVTGDEGRMVRLIKQIARRYPGAMVDHDETGNIYITVGQADYYPLLVAHTDTVHDIVKPETTVTETNGKRVTTEVLPYTIYHDEVLDHYSSPTGIGGDDKCGIFILFSLLPHVVANNLPVKMFFPVGEERGCIGTNAALDHTIYRKWFNNIAYAIELDRRGSGDIITDDQSWISPAFNDVLLPIVNPYGFNHARGSVTDITSIHQETRISACNLSCGYYRPHTADEYIVTGEVWNTRQATLAVLKTIPHRAYTVPKQPKKTPAYAYSDYMSGSSWWQKDHTTSSYRSTIKEEAMLRLPDGTTEAYIYNGWTVNPKTTSWYQKDQSDLMETATKFLLYLKFNDVLPEDEQLTINEMRLITDWIIDEGLSYFDTLEEDDTDV